MRNTGATVPNINEIADGLRGIGFDITSAREGASEIAASTKTKEGPVYATIEDGRVTVTLPNGSVQREELSRLPYKRHGGNAMEGGVISFVDAFTNLYR